MNRVQVSERPAILCDLHGVLVTPDIPCVIKTAYAHLPPWLLLKYLTLYLPLLSYHAYYIYHEGKSAEYIMEKLSDRFPDLKPHIPALYVLANCQKPTEKMWELVRTLRQEHYQVYLFSDIGENIYADLIARHPEFFALFTDKHISRRDDGWPKKPNPATYEGMKKIVKHHNNGNLPPLIMIDDSKNKIEGAQQAGITGIVYKSPEQAQQELFALL